MNPNQSTPSCQSSTFYATLKLAASRQRLAQSKPIRSKMAPPGEPPPHCHFLGPFGIYPFSAPLRASALRVQWHSRAYLTQPSLSTKHRSKCRPLGASSCRTSSGQFMCTAKLTSAFLSSLDTTSTARSRQSQPPFDPSCSDHIRTFLTHLDRCEPRQMEQIHSDCLAGSPPGADRDGTRGR
jgi:hypothetical protein